MFFRGYVETKDKQCVEKFKGRTDFKTYEQVKSLPEFAGILAEDKVSNLYIAQVKQKYGIIERENYNKAKNENAKQPKCPKEKADAVVEALKHFQMI